LKIELRAEQSSQITAGRKPDNSDPLGIDVPLTRMGPYYAHGLLRVLEVFRILRKTPLLGNPIFKNRTICADGIKPVTHLGSFDVVREVIVAATWKHNRCDVGILRWVRQVYGEIWFAYICNPHRYFSRHDAIRVRCGIVLRPWNM
jgi:hypothetical protein